LIFDLFITDFRRIINNSPKVVNQINTWRGVNSDYLYNYAKTKKKVYKNTQFLSTSFDLSTSHYFIGGDYFTNERTHTTVIEDKIDIRKLTKEQMKNMLTEIMSDKNKTTIINCDKPFRNAEHPTMKPILLLAPLIKNSSKENELVADGFLGSGSTMVASHQLKRKCYGMELDPKYCQVIIDRMKKLDPTLEIKRNGIRQE
jgi:DNA modification methylase